MTARVGLIIPSSNRMVEQEMVQGFPQGVYPHVTRLRMTGSNRMGLDQLLPRVEEATRALVDAMDRSRVIARDISAGAEARRQAILPLSRPLRVVA